MTPPKRIYLEFNNVPPCNFGALWFEDEFPGGVAYRLESDVNEELARKDEEIERMNTVLETVADKVLFSTHTNRDIGEYAQSELRAISNLAKSLMRRS